MKIDLTSEIRNILNHPWKKEILLQDKVKWNKIWASLDTFDDTIEAINFYKQLDSFNSDSGGYLFIYGLLQAINLQQDAINNLHKALFNEDINWKIEYPQLYQIRENRNNSIGHPTNRKNDSSFHMIGRSSINNNGFTLSSYYPKDGRKSNHYNIDLIECIDLQLNLLKEILLKTMSNLENEFKEHKNKFNAIKLSNSIPSDYNYHISKLFEHTFRNYELVELNFNVINETIKKIRQGIKDRYFSVQALSGVEDTILQIEYILQRLDKTLIKEKIEDECELRIFISTLKNLSEELFEMITEIDKEFS